MNRKQKSKDKHNKPSNSSLIQKQSSEIKSNEQCAEQSVTLPVSDNIFALSTTENTTELVSEIPKAPKRKRGAKNKEQAENKDGNYEKKEQTPEDKNVNLPIPHPCSFTVTEDRNEPMCTTDIKTETLVTLEQFTLIEPAARKKKNKNKKKRTATDPKNEETALPTIISKPEKILEAVSENKKIFSEEIKSQTETGAIVEVKLQGQVKKQKKKDKKNKKQSEADRFDTIINTNQDNISEIKFQQSLKTLSGQIASSFVTENSSKKADSVFPFLIDDDNSLNQNTIVEVLNEKQIVEENDELKDVSRDSSPKNDNEWKMGSGKHKKKKNISKKDTRSFKPEVDLSVKFDENVSNTDIASTQYSEESVQQKDIAFAQEGCSKLQSASKSKEIKANDETSSLNKEQDLMEINIIEGKFQDVSEKTSYEIDYPRSTSEQSSKDTNNNTTIREISSNTVPLQKLTTLEIPIVIPNTPFIESAKCLPVIQSNVMPTSIEIIEESTLETTESKVVEENDNLDDLRLSIEKSLVELTFLDQYEDSSKSVLSIEEMQSSVGKTITNPIKLDIKCDETDTKQEIKQRVSNPVLLQSTERGACEHEDTKIEETKTDKLGVKAIESHSIKDIKGKGKSRKKCKQDSSNLQKAQRNDSKTAQTTTTLPTEISDKENKTDHKQNTDNADTSQTEKQKQSEVCETSKESKKDTQNTMEKKTTEHKDMTGSHYDTIENLEDALTSSVDDVNKSFEIIVNNSTEETKSSDITSNKNENIPITEYVNDRNEQNNDSKKHQDKQNPITSHSKNLLGHPDIPVSSSKTDYKKQKNKTPNTKHAKAKIKDSNDVDKENKDTKESQTGNKNKLMKYICNEKGNKLILNNSDEEYVCKYSFRKVFLSNKCHVCKKDLRENRIPCHFCNLIFYCSQKHKDEDWNQHQPFCFSVSSIVNLKDTKYIYSDTKDVSGQNYRLLRMQAIISCEKILQRKLAPWEQEALLYPRMCGEIFCREWRQNVLKDCDGCGQVAYCKEYPHHFPKDHQRWCKSYFLYQKLVEYQQTKGRLEPKLPSRVITNTKFMLPDKINELLAMLYEEKIDIDDMQYAALTQLATAPLTAAYCYQLYDSNMNSSFANGVHKNTTFTIHVVGAELQFEADALNKWEIFFLHLKPDVKELNVVLIGPELNPSNLPLDLLSKINVCIQSKPSSYLFAQHRKPLESHN